MTRRLIGAWTWIGTIASLAIIIFSGLSYFRVWGSRVVFSAIGEAIFFVALFGFLFLLARLLGVFQKKEPG
jgi:hypothetical protein